MDTLPIYRKTGLVLLVFLCTASLVAAPPAKTAACVGPAQLEARLHAHLDADTYGELGNWFGENHKLDCAAQAFRAAVKLGPDSPLLNYLLGLSLYTAGHAQEAIQPLQKSIQLSPNEDKTHLLLASVFASLGSTKEAFAEWQTALKIDPNSKMALDGLAKIFIAAGDYQTVISHLSSVDLDENLTLDLAIAYGKADMLDDAARVLNDGLKAYPNSDALTTTLVTVYAKQLRYQDASKVAKDLALRNPHDIEAQRIYLRILVINGEDDEAEPLAHKLLTLAPNDADFLYLNGTLERTAGNYVIARKHLAEAVALNPNHYNSRYNYGVVLEQLKDIAGAKVQFEKAIELGAQEPEIRFELAKVLRTLGETEQAQEQLKLYQQALKGRADRTLAAQKSTQAAQAVAAGDNQKAAVLYREASAVVPYDAGIAYRLAMVLNALGDTEGQRTALEQAIKSDSGYAPAQYQLGYVESRSGDAAGAEQQFRLAVKAAPGYVQAWVALAATLAMESRFPEAQEAVETALKLDPSNQEALDLSKTLATNQAQH
jgi:tetratricopeptide (TPR) repeat protein